jgi:hypothetical protein
VSSWFERFRKPLCAHNWEVIGHLIDRHEGYLVVVRCVQCGARQQVPPRAQLGVPEGMAPAPRQEG